jgi:hypothetical protein
MIHTLQGNGLVSILSMLIETERESEQPDSAFFVVVLWGEYQ